MNKARGVILGVTFFVLCLSQVHAVGNSVSSDTRAMQSLNPQPDPPSKDMMKKSQSMQGLNPQPDPPSKGMMQKSRSMQRLNPQPDPPSSDKQKMNMNLMATPQPAEEGASTRLPDQSAGQ